MSNIKNEAKVSEEKVDINRAQLEHRATWMGLIYDEAEKAGCDAEGIIRKAIKRCGNMHGEGFKAACQNPQNCEEFKKVFLNEIGIKTFEMDNIKATHDDLNIEFHYCGLVNAWKKLGFDDERCAKLCDMAMDGDRGIAEAMGLKLDLTDTIAKGCPTCKLHFHK
jgi:hypothetical protein